MRNNGDGTFTDVSEKAACGTGAVWGQAAALDYDRDGHLDLFVASYVNFDRRRHPSGPVRLLPLQ
jgi:hypothetical protein